MARSRNLKPGFFQNEYLVELPFETRLLFAGLPCIADREGRLEDRPKKIKMQLFPADSVDIEPMLADLERCGFILRYTAQGSDYIQIINFCKHQNPHHAEKESLIPAPDEPEGSPGQAPDKPSSSRADSLNLIPDSLSCNSDESHTDDAEKPKKTKPENQRFADWWDAYGKKVNRKKCEAKWKKLDWPKLGVTPDDLIADAQNRRKHCRRWKEGFQPDPLTYLNGERWGDEIDIAPAKSSLPKDDEQLPRWAAERDLRQPQPGESYWEYRKYLEARA